MYILCILLSLMWYCKISSILLCNFSHSLWFVMWFWKNNGCQYCYKKKTCPKKSPVVDCAVVVIVVSIIININRNVVHFNLFKCNTILCIQNVQNVQAFYLSHLSTEMCKHGVQNIEVSSLQRVLFEEVSLFHCYNRANPGAEQSETAGRDHPPSRGHQTAEDAWS